MALSREDQLVEDVLRIRRTTPSPIVAKAEVSRRKRVYFHENITRKQEELTENVRRNLEFLKLRLGRMMTVNNIIEHMGITVDPSVYGFLNDKEKLYSLKVVIIASEFYGVPVEDILFRDLSARDQIYRTPLYERLK